MLPPGSEVGDSGPDCKAPSLLFVEITGGLTGSSGLADSKSRGDFRLRPTTPVVVVEEAAGLMLPAIVLVLLLPRSCRLLGSSRDSLNEDEGGGL